MADGDEGGDATSRENAHGPTPRIAPYHASCRPAARVLCPLVTVGGRRRTARGDRVVHLAGLLVLPACKCLSERDGAAAARRAAARLPRHLLGQAWVEGSVLVASRDRSPGALRQPIRRRLLHAGDRRRR